MAANEQWHLEADRCDLLRACGDAGAVDLWPVLVDVWERIPRRDRVHLRGRFILRIVAGAHVGAHVGVPVTSAAVGVPEIVLSREDGDLAVSYAHELAHVRLGHCDLTGYTGPAVVDAFDVPASAWAVALADGLGRIRSGMSDADAAKEKAAWRLVRAWGFAVPEGWT